MLVNFRVENYKSFKDFSEFSLRATKLKNLKESNTFELNNISLLKSAVIYGANASGKSNLVNALKDMKNIIISSLNLQKTYKHQPFLLNTSTEDAPTIFEIEFILDQAIYKYGFVIANDASILEEWLYQRKLESRAREVMLFKRIKNDFSISKNFKEAKNLEDKTRQDTLFLSVLAGFNGEISLAIYEWFTKELNIFSSFKEDEFKYISFEALEYKHLKEDILSFIQSADTGISGLEIKQSNFDEFIKNSLKNDNLDYSKFVEPMKKLIETLEGEQALEEDLPKSIQTKHIQYDKNNKFQTYKTFDLDFESMGTQRLLALSAPIIMSLKSGLILILDELDNSLHTDLVRAIIKLFNSKETNPNNAQLIFTTHDTNLLDQKLFRRDQIWFTEKNIYGVTDLYSLVEYGKGTRNDTALERNYLEGKYGAKPHIDSLTFEVE